MFEQVKKRVKAKPNATLPNIRDEPGKPFDNHICLGCGKSRKDTGVKVFMTCARCKAVKYCSRECQVNDWKGNGLGPTKPRKHKDICPELRESVQEFQSHPTAAGPFLRKRLFGSWADQHHPEDGSFHAHEFLAQKRLLGGAEVGFWAIPDVMTPYHAAGKDIHGFQNGQMLLHKTSFPSMADGWTSALSEAERVDVTKPPPNPTSGGLFLLLRGWEDYLALRNLPPTSVAPLLMGNVLTIYQMIVHELQLPALQKSHLQVYVLAVESELNQIPLLQELLYLLPPGTDLELIYISPAAKAICDEAKGKTCLLTNGEYVLDAKNGKSRLRVKLEKQHGLYEDVPNNIIPDAVIGLNTGLGSYQTWGPAMHKIIRVGTPFCFSDQTKLIHRFTETNWLPKVIDTINKAFPNHTQLEMPDLSITLNPFHQIIGRDVAYVLAPNVSNGYLLTGFP